MDDTYDKLWDFTAFFEMDFNLLTLETEFTSFADCDFMVVDLSLGETKVDSGQLLCRSRTSRR